MERSGSLPVLATTVERVLGDPASPRASVDGRDIWLTGREWHLLRVLVDADGATVTRERLYAAVWGQPLRRNDRSLDVYVHRLRGRLAELAPDYDWIHTHPNVGYRLGPAPRKEQR